MEEEERYEQIVEAERIEAERKFNREDRVSVESYCLIGDIFRVLDPTSKWELDDLLLFTDSAIHKLLLFYEVCVKIVPELRHPFTPLVQAWHRAISTKRITKEDDHKRPVSVLKHPLSNVRELRLDASLSETTTLPEFATPQRIEQASQQTLAFVEQSALPTVMPLDVATPLGVPPNTRTGAVHHTIPNLL